MQMKDTQMKLSLSNQPSGFMIAAAVALRALTSAAVRTRQGRSWMLALGGFLAFAGGALYLLAPQAVSGAPALTVTPITWNVIGVDSNDPINSGPDTFMVGPRVCNTGDAPATNVV